MPTTSASEITGNSAYPGVTTDVQARPMSSSSTVYAVEDFTPPATLRQDQNPLAKKFERGVTMLAWGYNEEELVADFLEKAIKLLDANISDWEIVFVNDGSTDRTGEILDKYAAKEKRIRAIHNERNLNVGQSCKRAIQNASKEYFFWQTVDWSYDIRDLRIYLELLNYYDIVQGIRPTPIRLLSYIPVLRSIYRVRSRSDNFQKAIVSLSNYYVLRILFGVNFHDFQNVVFYPTKLLHSFRLEGDSSFLAPECLLKSYASGARFLEVPIPFIPRSLGEAKGTKITSILRSIKDICKAWIKWGWNYRFALGKQGKAPCIHRVADPFYLDEEVIALAVPLFSRFR